MRFLNDIRKYEQGNTHFLNLLNYYFVKKDIIAIKHLLLNIGMFTKDPFFINRYALSNSFFNSKYCQDLFGISEDIINTMKNMTFSGNVNIKVPFKTDQTLLEPIMYSNQFHETIKEVYKEAITAYNHKAYLIMFTEKVYEVKNENDYVEVGNKFVKFHVVPSFEGEYCDGVFKWKFYKDIVKTDALKNKVDVSHEFIYEYTTVGNETKLKISGKEYGKDSWLSEKEVKEYLNIQAIEETYNYTPYFVLDMIDSMLPNIYNIEGNLAQALYFQNEDLSNSQTHIYTPETMLYKLGADKDFSEDYRDRYKTSHIVKGDGLGQTKIEVVEGKSSIDFIEKNIAMNVMRACIDAKISSASLQFSTVDRIGNNTEVGETRERASIRLRENHINILKNYIALVISTYLKVLGKNVRHEEVTVIFDPYITPSVETTTNVLAKQVQFGLKSREQAVKDLNKNEMSDEDIEFEVEKIKEFTTQQDFNSQQQIKAGSDNQKQEQQKDNTNLKVDNNLKSSGIEE